MAIVASNGIRLEVETFGKASHPPVLLIIGLSCQLIHWHTDFCQRLADHGYFVIRFDNRDTGLSTKINSAGPPDIQEILTSMMMGLKVSTAYGIDDMSKDALGLLDALNIEKVHLCGMSMGGMIAQTLAVQSPDRVSSLTSIYSTTGNPALPPPKPEAMQIVYKRPPSEKHANIEHTVEVYRVLWGSGLPFDKGFNTLMAEAAFARSYYPEGTERQMAAILTQNDRREQLAALKLPSLVVHGSDDPLVHLACGQDTADAIPGAEFVVIDGMGHELPTLSNDHWAEIFQHLVAFLGKGR